MKNQPLSLTAAAALSAVLFAGAVFARGPHKGRHCGETPRILEVIPDLTDEQRSKIEAIHESKQDEMKADRKAGLKLWVELKKLAENEADETEVNAKIDEIAVHHAQVMKKRFAHHREVAKILSEEQKEYLKDLGPGFLGHGFGCCGRGHKRHGMKHGW
ncbi:MAG: periplasmic heavy metal sensor [Chitinivibrionales bacterium]|nr:periplasmic heavy metal sensor [Chitinivibrionales bacterium]